MDFSLRHLSREGRIEHVQRQADDCLLTLGEIEHLYCVTAENRGLALKEDRQIDGQISKTINGYSFNT